MLLKLASRMKKRPRCREAAFFSCCGCFSADAGSNSGKTAKVQKKPLLPLLPMLLLLPLLPLLQLLPLSARKRAAVVSVRGRRLKLASRMKKRSRCLHLEGRLLQLLRLFQRGSARLAASEGCSWYIKLYFPQRWKLASALNQQWKTATVQPLWVSVRPPFKF